MSDLNARLRNAEDQILGVTPPEEQDLTIIMVQTETVMHADGTRMRVDLPIRDYVREELSPSPMGNGGRYFIARPRRANDPPDMPSWSEDAND